MSGETTGQRIARARRRRGLSQAVLAGLIGRSESWLSQVERGQRQVDSFAVLTRLAAVLRVGIEEITEPSDGSEEGARVYTSTPQIEQAMMRYDAVSASISREKPRRAVSISHLRETARAAYEGYQATRYEATGQILPALICDAETASRAAGIGDPAVCSVRALVYDVAAALLNRVGEPILAWAAADRAMAAAESSGEPVLAAAGAWRLSYVIISRKHPLEALELAMGAADALGRVMRSPSPEQLSVYGALHLAASTAAAATYDRTLTATLLLKARGIADRIGEANHFGTAFGHMNVAIHTIATSMQLGDARTAVETGESLDPAGMPAGLVGRRTQVSLDLARAYTMRRQDAAAVNLLLAAESLSPQLIQYDPRTREVLTELLRREHRPSTPELRPLAHRAGVI